jgi:hypothetical protein
MALPPDGREIVSLQSDMRRLGSSARQGSFGRQSGNAAIYATDLKEGGGHGACFKITNGQD